MERNLILQGWLTKSPPENKIAGPFKLFKAKWRKRYFVLYEPLASESLPGTRAALDYYNNEKYQKKLGTIDLGHCDEVLIKLDASNHKHVFSLKTKHRGRDRIYYLATNTEPDMNKWVDCLCLALGLKENPDNHSQPQQTPLAPQTTIHQPVVQTQRSSPGSIRGVPPGRYVDNPSESSPPPATQHPVSAQHPNGVPANHVIHTPPKPPRVDLPHQKSEAYIPLVDCYTGEKHSTVLGLGDKMADHRASVDSIPPEPPPAPPMKTGRKLSEEVGPPGDLSLYDSPTKSYVNLGVDNNENIYKIPRGEGEGVYKMPRALTLEGEGVYNVPRSDQDEEGIYKIPRSDQEEEGIYKIPRSEDQEGVYNTPRSDRVASIHGDSDTASHKLSRLVDVSANGIYNVPRSDPVVEEEDVYKLPRPTPGYTGTQHDDDDDGIYKIPPPSRGTQHDDDDDGIYKIPPPSRGNQQRDVSLFSQVLLPGVTNSMTGSTMSQRYSPDGEPSPGDELYNVPALPTPPPRPMRNSNSSNDSQSALLDHSPDGSSGTGDVYDIPRSMTRGHTMADYRTKATVSVSTDLYDAPKSWRKTSSENNLLESVVPVPSKSQSALGSETAFTESRYQNLPPKSLEDSTFPRSSQRTSHHPVAPPTRATSHYINTHPIFDDLYDIPPPHSHLNDSEKITHTPPPPKPCQSPALHSYVNAPGPPTYVNDIDKPPTSPGVPPPSAHSHESFYMPMASGGIDTRESMFHQAVRPHEPVLETLGDLYTDMHSVAALGLYSTPSSRPVNPSVHDVVPPPNRGGESYICQSSRTRSFKRPLPMGEVALPTRRTGLTDEVTSSDEESTSSGSHHDRSSDNIVYRHTHVPTYPMTMNSNLAKIGSLNCTPPAPKRQGEVQYLDLALENSTDKERSPMTIRSQALGNVSPTDYKEIDFIKTKALNDTQRDVESKRRSSERKSSERSIDD